MEFDKRFADFHVTPQTVRLFQNAFEVNIVNCPEKYQMELADLRSNNVLNDELEPTYV